jgi:uncharacterized protein with FMN-binding domain
MTPDERPNTIKSRLLVLSSAAVLTVYAAGYARTRAAAERIAEESGPVRPVVSNATAVAPDSVVVEPVAGISETDSARVKDAAPRAVHADTNGPRHPSAANSRSDGKRSLAAITALATTATVDSSMVSAGGAPEVTPPASTIDTSAAATPVPAADSTAQAEKSRGQFKDGLYTGWGTSRHGDIEASVEIKNGHITAASITQCLTRYSCSWISDLPPEVLARQSAAVDYVSGATQSSSAFANAIAEALVKAK